MRKVAIAVAVVVGGVGLVGCGDDSDGGSVEGYCELNDELNAQQGRPSDEQLDEIVAIAPEEIRDSARTLVEFFKDNDGDLFETDLTPEVEEVLEELETFEAANCETPA